VIPHLLYYTETDGIGGAEQYFMELIRHSRNIAKRTTVCTPNFRSVERIRECCEAGGANFQIIPFNISSSTSQKLWTALTFFRRQQAALIHFSLIGTASCFEALVAAILLRSRFFITEHQIGDQPSGRWKYHCYRRITTLFADRVITVSSEAQRRLITHHDTSPSKITVIPLGVATCYFDDDPNSRIAYRQSLRIAEDELVFIQVAHLLDHKRPALALQAFDDLPEAVKKRSRLLLVGGGPLRPSLEQCIAERGLEDRVHLLGVRNDVCELLNMSDVFLLTSDDESCSFAVLEAMASGLPVITTAKGGPREIVIDQETGFIVDGSDRDPLVRRMVQLAESPCLRQRLGCAGRERAAKNFRVETMLQRTHSLYAHVWNRWNSDI
jgi:glycosyltransferase involved in cell wall biosynthesis